MIFSAIVSLYLSAFGSLSSCLCMDDSMKRADVEEVCCVGHYKGMKRATEQQCGAYSLLGRAMGSWYVWPTDFAVDCPSF